MVALPYNFEQHDIVAMMLQGHTSDQMYRRSMDAFDCLYKESAERAKIMSISVHPYISALLTASPMSSAHSMKFFRAPAWPAGTAQKFSTGTSAHKRARA